MSNMSTRCTVCNRQIFPTSDECYMHRELHVLLCKVCVKVHQAGEITKDEKGQDDFCRWCADGGHLIVCDTCSNVFCRKCIKTNLGRTKANEIRDMEKWNCFVCNSEPIRHIQEVHKKMWAISARGIAELEYTQSSERVVKEKPKTRNSQQLHIDESGDNAVATAESFAEFIANIGDGKTVNDDATEENDEVMKVEDSKDESEEDDGDGKVVETREKEMENLDVMSLVVQQAKKNLTQVRKFCLNAKATSKVERNLQQMFDEASEKLSSIMLYMTCHEDALTKELPSRSEKLTAASLARSQAQTCKPGQLIESNSQAIDEGGETGSGEASDDENDDDDDESEEEGSEDGDFQPSTSRARSKSSKPPTASGESKKKSESEGEEEEAEPVEVDEDSKFEKGVFDLINRKPKKGKKIVDTDEEEDDEKVEEEEEGGKSPDAEGDEKLPLPKKKKKNPFAKYNADDKVDDDDVMIEEDEDLEELEDMIDDDDDDEEESKQQNGDDDIGPSQMTAEEAAAKKLADMMHCSDDDAETDEDVSQVLDKEDAKAAKKPKKSKEGEEEEAVAEKPEQSEHSSDEEGAKAKQKSGYRHPLLNVRLDSDAEDENDSKSSGRKTRKRKAEENEEEGSDGDKDKKEKRLRVDDDGDEAMEVDEQPSGTAAKPDDDDEATVADCSQPLFATQPDDDDDDIGEVEGMEDIQFLLKNVKIPVVNLTFAEIKKKQDDLLQQDQRKSSGSGTDKEDDNDDDNDDDDVSENDEEVMKERKSRRRTSSLELKISSAEEDADDDGDDVIDDDDGGDDDDKSSGGDDDEDDEYWQNLKSKKANKKSASPTDADKKASPGGESPIRIDDSDDDDDDDVKIVGVQMPGSTSSEASGSKDGDDDDDDDEMTIIRRKKPKRFINDYYQKVNSGDEFQESIANRTRRRRPKVSKEEKKKDSDDDESSEEEEEEEEKGEEKSPKSRKNIRRILKDSDLSQETKLAESREIRRKLRMTMNNDDVVLVSESDQGIGRILFSKNPRVEIARPLVRVLKSHQVDGIKFLWTNVVENVQTAKKSKGNGCILAHCMGLGKTLQTITFLHTVLTSTSLETLNTALVLCPTGTVLNWAEEFKKWTRRCSRELRVYKINQREATNASRKLKFKQWHQTGGIMILGYGLFRQLCTPKGTRKQKALLKEIGVFLLNPGADIVVCDEGHILKNSKTTLSSVVNQIRTRRRIVLTGTPLQNNLREYHCMVSFVKPRLLGTLKEFNNRFANPIQNGQHSDSTRGDVHIMKKRSHVLHELLSGCVQRKDFKCLSDQLKPKFEYVLFIRLTPLQIRMYDHYLTRVRSKSTSKEKLSSSLFNDFINFLLIVSHPRVFEVKKQIKDKEEEKRNYDDDFIDEEEEEAESTTDSEDDDGDADNKKIDIDSIPNMKIKELKELIAEHGGNSSQCKEKSELVELLQGLLSTTSSTDRDWWQAVVPKDATLLHKCESSGKIMVMLEILKQARNVGDKVVLFSQSVVTLTMIEVVLKEIDDANKEFNKRTDIKREEMEYRWKKDSNYLRIDGTTSFDLRKAHVDRFNRDGTSPQLLLVSTRAGGIGINLYGANRAIIFDACWNPTHDLQSIYRIYRFGQKKCCYIYRLIAQGTMEQKIYERQISKRSIASRVVDEQQVGRHFSHNDLLQLYDFTPDRPTTKHNKKDKKDEETEAEKNKPKPKDRLLKDLLEDSNAAGHIVSFQEEDTLLGHQVTEELSEGERRAAWDEYDRENHPPVLASSPLLQFTGPQLKAMVVLAQNELKRNQILLDKLKEFTYVRILALVANHDCKLPESSRYEIALRYLNQRQVFLYQLNQTRKYILHKIEQAQYCLEYGHAKTSVPLLMPPNPSATTNPMYTAATNDPRNPLRHPHHRSFHPQQNFPYHQHRPTAPPGGRADPRPFFAGYYQNGGFSAQQRPHV